MYLGRPRYTHPRLDQLSHTCYLFVYYYSYETPWTIMCNISSCYQTAYATTQMFHQKWLPLAANPEGYTNDYLAPTWSMVVKFGGEENILLAPPATGGRLHHARFNSGTVCEQKWDAINIIPCSSPALILSSLPVFESSHFVAWGKLLQQNPHIAGSQSGVLG